LLDAVILLVKFSHAAQHLVQAAAGLPGGDHAGQQFGNEGAPVAHGFGYGPAFLHRAVNAADLGAHLLMRGIPGHDFKAFEDVYPRRRNDGQLAAELAEGFTVDFSLQIQPGNNRGKDSSPALDPDRQQTFPFQILPYIQYAVPAKGSGDQPPLEINGPVAEFRHVASSWF